MEKVDIFDQEVGRAAIECNTFSFVARSVSRSEALSEY